MINVVYLILLTEPQGIIKKCQDIIDFQRFVKIPLFLCVKMICGRFPLVVELRDDLHRISVQRVLRVYHPMRNDLRSQDVKKDLQRSM